MRDASHTGVPPEQSALVRHATHKDVVVSQTGALAVVQLAFVRHPARHVEVMASQTGLATPQSVLAKHATHA